MTDLEIRALGDAGLAYVQAHLDNVNVLCTALMRVVDGHRGETFTLAPRGISSTRLTQFDAGGLLLENLHMSRATHLPDGSAMMAVASLIDEQGAFLRKHVLETQGAICVIDDFNPRWSDQKHLLPTSFGVGEVVYNLLATTNSDDEFAGAVRCSNAIWHGVAAVCRAPLTLDASRTCTPAALERVAATAELITCTAYDGEGFVAWRRT